MKKEVATKQESAVSTDVVTWGEEVSVGKDLLVSKVLLMQGLSELVANEQAKMGEFRDSITTEMYGSAVAPMAFIPFHVRKSWDLMEEVEPGKFEWMRTVPLIEDPTKQGYNDNWEWTAEVNGVMEKRVRRLDFFCLIPSQVAAGNALPVTISFKSTVYKQGQILLNQMYVRNKMQRKSPAAVVMSLGALKEKNEKGTFYVPTVVPLRDATNEEQTAALQWYKMIQTSNVIVDESDAKTEAAPTGPVDVDTKSAGRF